MNENIALLQQQFVDGSLSVVSPKPPRSMTVGQRLIARLAHGAHCGSLSDLSHELLCSVLELQIVRRELFGEDRVVVKRCPFDGRRRVLTLPGSPGCGHRAIHAGIVPKEELP